MSAETLRLCLSDFGKRDVIGIVGVVQPANRERFKRFRMESLKRTYLPMLFASTVRFPTAAT